MDAFLSVQGASAPVKKKSFFSKFTRLNMLRLARAVIPAAVLMMFFPQLAMAAQGQDLMASGNTTVKATFGKDSSVVKWVVLAEVLVGAVMYMMTKNVKFLAGFAIISVFIAVGISPESRAFEGLVDMDHGYIKAGEDGVTSVPGIFAAGDVRTKLLRQIVTAAADGANAVTSAERYLTAH